MFFELVIAISTEVSEIWTKRECFNMKNFFHLLDYFLILNNDFNLKLIK